MIVHVIVPSGTRFGSEWKDSTPDSRILRELEKAKVIYGYNKTVTREGGISKGMKEVKYEDKTSGFRYDNPETIVAIVIQDADGWKEVRRLKGPKVEKVIDKPVEAKV